MKKMKLILVLVGMLIITGSFCVNGQVVIGSSTQAANPGAILDLSKKDDGLNTGLGLLLPSVNLTSSTIRLVSEVPNVEGMLVYCPGGAGNLAKGLYVWDGTEWKGVVLA
jgi:hypothetical protein